MNRWEKAQKAEMQYKLQYYGPDCDSGKIVDSTPEYRAIGLDPLTVRGTVVDIGGAHGSLTIPFTNAAERIVVDPLYEKIKANLPGIRGIAAVGEDLPFKNSSVNFVILRNVIDHMLDPEAIVREAHRVLAQDGLVYFMVNTFLPPLKPLFPLLDRIDGPHPVHLTNSSIRTMLSKYFHVIRDRTCGSGLPSLHPKRFAGWLIKREYYALLAHKTH
jgi:SAM-dependent methyltransferase